MRAPRAEPSNRTFVIEVQLIQRVATEGLERRKVADGAASPDRQDSRDEGVAQPRMPGHRSGSDQCSGSPAQRNIGLGESGNEPRQVRRIARAITVEERDDRMAVTVRLGSEGLTSPGQAGPAVAPSWLVDDDCAGGGSSLEGAVARTAVNDQHAARSGYEKPCDDVTDRRCLIDHRHNGGNAGIHGEPAPGAGPHRTNRPSSASRARPLDSRAAKSASRPCAPHDRDDHAVRSRSTAASRSGAAFNTSQWIAGRPASAGTRPSSVTNVVPAGMMAATRASRSAAPGRS